VKQQSRKRFYRLLWFLLVLSLLVTPIAKAEMVVTDQVELKQTKLVYLKKDQTSLTVVSVKNISDNAILGPIKLVIDSISASDVDVANPDGYTGNGKPYLMFITKKEELLSGKITFQKKLNFANPNNTDFSYTTFILASSGAETINGIMVPPAPDEAVNNSTIEGVDSNNNDIRDDVERFIAEEFGADAIMYEEVKIHIITLQIALRNPNSQTISDHLDSFRCINDYEKLEELDRITTAMLNTRQRMGAYGNTFAGVLISDEGCQNEND
jgi:hypothetical protein